MTRSTIKVGRITWSYLDSGSGDEVWLAFHGYGQEAVVMSHFVETLQPKVRIVSFDLPLHGLTEIERGFIKPGDLAELLGKTLVRTGASSCSLIGFSLGGKIVLKMIELVPGKIERVVLVAPDGLRVNPFYWFATNTIFGKALFQLVIRAPKMILGPSWLISRSGLMNKKIHDFISTQMDSRDKRQRVYDTWQIFKNTIPNLDDVRKKIWRYNIKLTLVFGTKDRVIHPKLAKKLSGEKCKSAKVVMLETGHNLITKKNASTIQELIQ